MGTITNATPIANGQIISSDNSPLDNYYSFTLSSSGYVHISASNTYFKIYDANYGYITQIGSSGSSTVSTSTSLSAGTYYIQAIEFYRSDSNTFSISSTVMGAPAPAPEPDQDAIDDFVSRFYTEVLGRNYDQAGLDSWSDALINGSLSADDIAMGFFNSQEFLNKNVSNAEFVTIAYETLLGREADAGGYTNWLNQLNGGLARDTLLDGFIYSQEFGALADSYGITIGQNTVLSDIENFVSRFYTEVLGREYDQSGLDSWSQALENGSKTADDIAMGFFNSQEFLNKNVSNSEFVTIAYETLLGREADAGGYTNWLNQLNGGLNRDAMLDGFVYSQEFENLADSYGIEVGILPIQTPPVDDTVTLEDIAGSYNLLYADANFDGLDIHLDAADVTGSYMNITSSGNITMYVRFMGESITTTGTITEITDSTVTVYSYGEEFEYEYDWNDPYLTTSVDIYQDGINYSETDHWILS